MNGDSPTSVLSNRRGKITWSLDDNIRYHKERDVHDNDDIYYHHNNAHDILT